MPRRPPTDCQRHHRRDPDDAGHRQRKLAMVQVPPSEKLPDGIGGPALRAAAMKGDPTAAYEVGVRFAEGKGVAAESRRSREMV